MESSVATGFPKDKELLIMSGIPKGREMCAFMRQAKLWIKEFTGTA